jgi:hypothetical protein
VTLLNSQFTGNRANANGGGLATANSLSLTRTHFINNVAQNGGGLYQTGSGNGRLVNALFARNRVGGSGAGLYLVSTGAVDVIHSTIASPTLAGGAALFFNNGTAWITNTIIASHSLGILQAGGTATENYNLFFGNTTDRVGLAAGINSLNGNPAFTNPTADNYKLAAGSAATNQALDVGVTDDFEGEIRPQAGAPDIGYDESPFAPLSLNYIPIVLK